MAVMADTDTSVVAEEQQQQQRDGPMPIITIPARDDRLALFRCCIVAAVSESVLGPRGRSGSDGDGSSSSSSSSSSLQGLNEEPESRSQHKLGAVQSNASCTNTNSASSIGKSEAHVVGSNASAVEVGTSTTAESSPRPYRGSANGSGRSERHTHGDEITGRIGRYLGLAAEECDSAIAEQQRGSSNYGSGGGSSGDGSAGGAGEAADGGGDDDPYPDSSGGSWSYQPEDPLRCVSYLLSNLLLRCTDGTGARGGGGGGYDARMRSIVKMASVHVLGRQMEAEAAMVEAAESAAAKPRDEGMDEEEKRQQVTVADGIEALEQEREEAAMAAEAAAVQTGAEVEKVEPNTRDGDVDMMMIDIDHLQTYGSFMEAEGGRAANESNGGDDIVAAGGVVSSVGGEEAAAPAGDNDVNDPIAAEKGLTDEEEEGQGDAKLQSDSILLKTEQSAIDSNTLGQVETSASDGDDVASTGDELFEGPVEPGKRQQDQKHESDADSRTKSIHFLATRKFEEIERTVARKLYHVLILAESKKASADKSAGWQLRRQNRHSVTRSVQIGIVAVGAGALLGITGGLAAPGIAAGIAALGIGTTAVLTTLTSSVMLATLFGVGGGSLAMYKMSKRTGGITEFRVRREGGGAIASIDSKGVEDGNGGARLPELRSSICISGWLIDSVDFQRPWGIAPTDPPLEDKLQLLKRFYSVHDPELVMRAEEELEECKEREDVLWEDLRKRYGSDPDNLLPIRYEALADIPLTQKEEDAVSSILVQCFIKNDDEIEEKSRENAQGGNKKAHSAEELARVLKVASNTRKDNPSASAEANASSQEAAPVSHHIKRFHDNTQPSSAWDFLSLYGGDLYTVTWQSEQLLSICSYANKLALQLAGTASKEVVQQTLTSAIFMGATLPMTVLMKLQNLIDEPWTLITMRADEAGVELAKALLQTEEHKPITLVGFSFGARIIYSCLKELAIRQKIWEKQKEGQRSEEEGGVGRGSQDGQNESDRIQREHQSNEQHQEEEQSTDSPSKSVAGFVANARKMVREQGSSLRSRTGTSPSEAKGMGSTNGGNEAFSREPASIVEDVVVMGLPQYIDLQSWLEIRRIVAGRLVNCYSKNDWILSLMFQLKNASAFRATCGTAPVGIYGVENLDISHLVSTHSNYCTMAHSVLRAVGFGEPKMMNTAIDIA